MHPRFLTAALFATFTLNAALQAAPPRPKITGVSHLAVYTSDAAATDHYYADLLARPSCRTRRTRRGSGMPSARRSISRCFRCRRGKEC